MNVQKLLWCGLVLLQRMDALLADECDNCGCLPKFPTHGTIIWDEAKGPIAERTGTVICKKGSKLAKEGLDHVACENYQWDVPSCVQDTTPAPDPPSFHSYVFSLQWIPGMCEVQTDCNVTRQHNYTTWTIHGLWPDNAEYCKGDKFDSDQIKGIISDLVTYWPSFKKGSSEAKIDLDFWKFEYRKHGKCALATSNINTELQYFTKALNLVKHFNLFKSLATAGIKPSDTKTYTKAAKDAALHKAFGPYQFKDVCIGKAGQQVLTEQRVCLDLQFNIMNCSITGNCKGAIRYAPAPTTVEDSANYVVWIAVGVTVGVVLVLAGAGLVLYKVFKARQGKSEPYSTFNNVPEI